MDIYDNIPSHVASFETPEQRSPASEIGAEARAREARCRKVVQYCALVQKHVHEYDSLDTAATILGRAIGLCPSIEARVELVKANKLLRAAIKAAAWLNNKRRRRHVDASTRNRNLDRFADALAEGILLLETEVRRNESSLIDYISATYRTDLPLTMPDSKSFIVRRVPIVVMVPENVRIDAAVPHLQIEPRLYLIKQVHVIGVNTERIKNREFDRTTAWALQRYGATVYETALRRPSSNINWYLLQDFHVEIVYAGFVDYLEIDTRNATAETALRTNRLRELRLEFERDHAALFQQIRDLTIDLDNTVDRSRALAATFGELTAATDTDEGLRVNARDYARLETYLRPHYEKLIRAGASEFAAKRDTLAQRLAARATYYATLEHMRAAKVIRRQIKTLRHEVESRRYNRALSLGLVGVRETLYLDA